MLVRMRKKKKSKRNVMINDAGISNLYHYTYGRTVKSRFFVKRNPALFIELPSPRFISRAPKRKREGGEEQRSHLPRSLWKRGRIVSIYFDIYYDILLERREDKGDKIRGMDGIRGRYLLNGDVNNAAYSTSDWISCSIGIGCICFTTHNRGPHRFRSPVGRVKAIKHIDA